MEPNGKDRTERALLVAIIFGLIVTSAGAGAWITSEWSTRSIHVVDPELSWRSTTAADNSGQIKAPENRNASPKNQSSPNQTSQRPQPAPPASARPAAIKEKIGADESQAATKKETPKRKEIWSDANTWVAIFTGVLTLATILMWRATKDNAMAARLAAEVAGRALTELERPYLFIKFGYPGFEFRIGNQLNPESGNVESAFVSRYDKTIEIMFVNFGRTPAIITEICDDYKRIAGVSAMPNAINPDTRRGELLPIGNASVNGSPYSFQKDAFEAFERRKLDADALLVDRFFCLGHVRYKDIFGGEYILGYCGRFDPVSGKFIPEGGDGYNYTRTERDPLAQKHG